MKDRIEINGVWYVRETSTPQPTKFHPEDLIHTMSCVWESDDWVFEATMMLRDDDPTDFFLDPTIDITDKRGDRDEWVEHDSDNPNWMFGVLNNDPESMVDANEMMDEQGLTEFRAFLKHLIEKGWLKK
jgi:hypothetical protein